MIGLCRTIAGGLLLCGTIALLTDQFQFATSAAVLAVAWFLASIVALIAERVDRPESQ